MLISALFSELFSASQDFGLHHNFLVDQLSLLCYVGHPHFCSLSYPSGTSIYWEIALKTLSCIWSCFECTWNRGGVSMLRPSPLGVHNWTHFQKGKMWTTIRTQIFKSALPCSYYPPHPYFQCCILMSYRQMTSRHFLMNISVCSQPWKTQPFQELYGRKMCKTNIYRLKEKGDETLKCKTCFQQKCHPSSTSDN